MVAPSAATAQSPQRESHCVVHVRGQAQTGELLVTEPECYSTFDEAMTAEGVDAWGIGASVAADSVAAAAFTIGTHYDGAGYTGSSTSVVGSDCGGGWLNVSATWDNRISSTRNGCPRVRHFSGTNLAGSVQSTWSPGGNLTTLDNQTSSIQYTN
jgi:hypothetical protein